MEKVNYPLDTTFEEYDNIKDKIVKIKTIQDNFCILHAFLNSTCKEYQSSPEQSKKIEILESFRDQLKEFLKAPSTNHDSKFFVKKIMSAYEMSNLKNQYSLKLNVIDGTIFDIIIVKKENNRGTHYSLFSQKTSKMLNPNSNFFDVLSLNFIRDMIDQRFLLKSNQENIKYFSEGEIEMKRNMQEITKKMEDRNMLLDPSSLLECLDYSECLISNILIRFLGEIFDINFFICRGWKLNLTVLDEIIVNKDCPYLIFFKTEGPVSISGIERKKNYETGGVKDINGINTILNHNKNGMVIEELKEILETDLEEIIMKKYSYYLKSMMNSFDLPIIYEEKEEMMGEEKEEMMEEEKEEMMEEEKEEMMEEEKEEMMEEDRESYIKNAEEIDYFDPEHFIRNLKKMQ